MASLTATSLPALGIVKLTLDWAPYRTEAVHLYRVEPDGREVEILGSPITLSGSVAIAYDTTAPLDVNLTYRAKMIDPVALRDEFNSRTSSNTWGTPEFSVTAGTWGSSGGVASNYNVAGGVATQLVTAVSSARQNTTPTSLTNARIGVTVSSPVNPTGALIRTGAVTRYLDTGNMYHFNIVHNTSGAITLNITKRIANVDTIIATTATPFTVSPNRKWRIVAESVGNRHRMSVWWATGADDAVSLEASDSVLPGPGLLGVRTTLLTGNTNTLPLTFTYDSAVVHDLSTYTLTSGTVNVTADPHGWVRDPLVPGNSIRLDNCADHTYSCLLSNNMVFFRGFGDAKYRSTTGVFDVNNAERPLAVAQTRKAPVTDLRFASVTLDDIRRVRTLFSSGRNLSLYLPEKYGWGLDSYGADMFTAGDLLESRLNRSDMRKPFRLWAAEIVPTDLDDDLPRFTVGGNGIPIPGATFGDMKATGKTFGQLKATGNTFLEFAQGIYT